MGLVAEHLADLIRAQVEAHGIVTWFDPQGCYGQVAENLTIPDGTVARYDGSFFALRHEIDPVLNADERPRFVVYVPMDPGATEHALAELEAVGIVMRPGQHPAACDTRLSLVAREALLGTGQWTADDAEQVAKDIEAGKYASLEEIEQVAVRRGEATGVLQLIFGTGNPRDVALRFLSDEGLDAALEEKHAVGDLAQLMTAQFGAEPADGSAKAYRASLARHVLASDYLASIYGDPPECLSSVPSASGEARDACRELATAWRSRRDLHDSYAAGADLAEKQLGLRGDEVDWKRIDDDGTFLGVERGLQRMVEAEMVPRWDIHLQEFARRRQETFWAEHIPAVRARWALILACAEAMREAERVEDELKTMAGDARGIFQAYTEGNAPLCLLDTHHRHMERRYHSFDFFGDDFRSLQQLVARARERYMQAASALAEGFLRSYQAGSFRSPADLRQTQIFAERVRPHLGRGKVAYVWVDALRYEMGRELADTLYDDFGVHVSSAVGSAPAVTEVGMAALLPGAEERPAVVPAADGRLALAIRGTAIKDRKDRISWLKAQAGVKVYAATLADLLPKPGKATRDGIRNSELVLVTSQEIDALCEGDNVPLARRTMDEMLHELGRGFRVLAGLGVGRIIVTADHGYVFGDELGNDMKIDAPGGKTVDLHRRVWVGQGGAANPAYLRADLADLDMGGDLEIATPWSLACFKVKGGASAYFHGGLSPQEIIIPVLTLTSQHTGTGGAFSDVHWTLTPGAARITTRLLSVRVDGSATNFFEEVQPRRVRLEVRANGRRISAPVSASYGFEEATGDVELRPQEGDAMNVEPNTVALVLREVPPQKRVAIHMLDAVSGAELARIEVPIAIAI